MTVLLIAEMLLQPCVAKYKILEKKREVSAREQQRGNRVTKYLNRPKLRNLGLADPVLERDFIVLLRKYLKSQFWLDGLANIPIFAYDIYNGYKDPETYEVTENYLLYFFMFLKLLRIFHFHLVEGSVL